ncbi:hypothetical protein AAUPMC_01197 [Pasteurella multocida subsp. multocida str. Anand1_cattle]|nr:hypothetical protein AAUPMC_01197 [Pasteurella multocida subsp. multocida str. Anand1_cattle]
MWFNNGENWDRDFWGRGIIRNKEQILFIKGM